MDKELVTSFFEKLAHGEGNDFERELMVALASLVFELAEKHQQWDAIVDILDDVWGWLPEPSEGDYVEKRTLTVALAQKVFAAHPQVKELFFQSDDVNEDFKRLLAASQP